uniref:RNA binding motif protein 12 n=1 Tax=Salmo trutta TaxID=8032 RepID=A0A674B0F4_SALTR
MAVVIRLQGLPIVAGTMDIRHFFSGLTIPDGGVHIVGGEHGEAFIVSATDEDARLGMMCTGGAIKGSKVSLLLSSKTEMQNMIELSRRRFETGNVGGGAGNGSRPGPPVNTCGRDHHRRSNMSSASPSTRDHARSRSPHNKEFCVYLKGLPYEAVNKQICEFFKNLDIKEDRIYIAYGPTGRAIGEGFVQLKNEIDYKVALSCHMQYMGSRFIQVHPISKKAMFEKIDSIRQNSESGKSPRNCAHISNIPYNVSKKDVHLFLEGIAVFEESLKVLVDSSGKGLGQAVVQFRVGEDALNAERLHRQKLNGRNAFVHLVTFEQMKEIERNPPQVKRGQNLKGTLKARHTAMLRHRILFKPKLTPLPV